MSSYEDFNPFRSHQQPAHEPADNIEDPQMIEQFYESYNGAFTGCHGTIHLDPSAINTTSIQSAYGDFPIDWARDFMDFSDSWDPPPESNKDHRVEVQALPTSNTPPKLTATRNVSKESFPPEVLDNNALRDSIPSLAHKSSKGRKAKKNHMGSQGSTQRIGKRQGPSVNKHKKVVGQRSTPSTQLERSNPDESGGAGLSPVASIACIQSLHIPRRPPTA